jgi:multidrug efflux system membrane fusion protein
MKLSRVAAVGLVAAAAAWIGSGYLLPREHGHSTAAITSETAGEKPFRVAVIRTETVPHSRKLTLSGRTEADRKVMAVARTNGVVSEIKVRRGDIVKEGDVIAILSDEAREAQVIQARSRLEQKRTERQAREKLVERGISPRLGLYDFEAQEKAAEAALAAAEAERERGRVLAPWSGIVMDIPTEVGQGLLPGKEVAQIVALHPMLAVVEVAERRLAGIKVGQTAEIRLVTGHIAVGRVRFVSKAASPVTRTYRVDVEIENRDGAIPDGITAEVAIPLEPVPATRIPRSALVFSSGGELGVRVVRPDNKVQFIPVGLVEDEQQYMWVDGLHSGLRLIVQGQDFVREGQVVEAVAQADFKTARQP